MSEDWRGRRGVDFELEVCGKDQKLDKKIWRATHFSMHFLSEITSHYDFCSLYIVHPFTVKFLAKINPITITNLDKVITNQVTKRNKKLQNFLKNCYPRKVRSSFFSCKLCID
ncbi:unnamed protein product [Moneuplotes crassus]|uniref:Uncharacterized protein n=1 Tax=Euplotes crassus TaxID=5936 RepID=A0AAD1XL43_EUPCR|nr:unnamed protein product [Moneuplotes crassus]